MALTSTDFNISFDLSSSTPKFVLTDITDYSSQSVSESDVTGKIKITAPSGVVYTGTNDVQVGTSRINSTTILVPTLSSGTPEVGLYTFDYDSTEVKSGVTTIKSKKKTFQYSYVKPTATNQATSDCLSPELKGSDTTNYLVNSITPSDRFVISAVSTSSNTFSLAGEKSAFVSVGDTFSVINSTGNNGDYTVTGVAYTKSSDTTVITVASVTDATVDGTLVTRKTTLFYPSVLQLSPLVGTEKIISTNSFYSQTHEFLFTTKGYWDYGNGIKIVDSFSSTKEIDVDCDVRLCDIFCCVNATFKEYLKYKCVNKTLADIALERYTISTSHLAALRTAFECGDSAAVDSLTTQIKEVAQCNDDCSCSDGDPTPITGLGGSGNVVVNAANSNIEVASNVVGNTTTYTVKLSQSVLDDIAASGSITTIGSSDSSITVLETPTGSNYAYDIKIPASTPVISPKEFMSFRVNLDITAGVPNYSNSISDIVIQNQSNFNENTVSISNPDGSSSPDYINQRFRISGFQNTNNNNYKIFTNISFVENNDFTSNSSNGLFYDYVRLQIVESKSGEVDLMVVDESGNALKKGDLTNYKKIYFNVQIIE
jgi:hypothetical protein